MKSKCKNRVYSPILEKCKIHTETYLCPVDQDGGKGEVPNEQTGPKPPGQAQTKG